jgi:hypothetical protein
MLPATAKQGLISSSGMLASKVMLKTMAYAPLKARQFILGTCPSYKVHNALQVLSSIFRRLLSFGSSGLPLRIIPWR